MYSNIIYTSARGCSTVAKFVFNRNPRNLEKLSIGYRPSGWHLEKPGREYWHKLFLELHGRHVTASVKHYTGAIPVKVSTQEWAIRKHLYNTTDKSAYRNLARILGRRCLETGITEVRCDLVAVKDGKLEAFLGELENSGVLLKEYPRYINPRPSDPIRPEKLWET